MPGKRKHETTGPPRSLRSHTAPSKKSRPSSSAIDHVLEADTTKGKMATPTRRLRHATTPKKSRPSDASAAGRESADLGTEPKNKIGDARRSLRSHATDKSEITKLRHTPPSKKSHPSKASGATTDEPKGNKSTASRRCLLHSPPSRKPRAYDASRARNKSTDKPKNKVSARTLSLPQIPSPEPGSSDASEAKNKSTAADSIETLTYTPVHFLRAHSKNDDPADIHTQIWEAAFEPDPQDPDRTTSLVATCGGNTICITDVNTGTVMMKYKHKEPK
jgi:hypothetical protein